MVDYTIMGIHDYNGQYNASKDYKDIKEMESYILIKHRITDECTNSIKEDLLLQLKDAYQTGKDLMDVLRGMLQQKSVVPN